jgi:hypothetical protein
VAGRIESAAPRIYNPFIVNNRAPFGMTLLRFLCAKIERRWRFPPEKVKIERRWFRMVDRAIDIEGAW